MTVSWIEVLVVAVAGWTFLILGAVDAFMGRRDADRDSK